MCLRKITGVKHSYWSRISNETVRQMVHARPLRQSILEQQLSYLGSIAARPSGNVLRNMIFQPDSTKLVPLTGPRRKGRPRASWATQLRRTAVQVAGTEDRLTVLWAPAAKAAWKQSVKQYCKSVNNPEMHSAGLS